MARSLAVEMALQDRARGRRIAEIRERAHLSQEEAARRAGVSLRSYQSWEAGGNIRPENRKNVAKALETTVEEVMGQAETPNPFRVADHIDQKIEGLADEFRDYVASIVEHMGEQDTERTADANTVRGLLQRQSDVLAGIENLLARQTQVLASIETLVATLPTEEGAREFVAALTGAARPDGPGQLGRTGTGRATRSLPAAGDQ